MTLCVNQSGTWRKITTLCVNDSGSWRKIQTGCIKHSNAWRRIGGAGAAPTTVGSTYGGGTAICLSSTFGDGGVVWIVAPGSTQVTRNWYSRNDAVTTAQANAACGDWFIPTIGQLSNPGYVCRTYWGPSTTCSFWSNTETSWTTAKAPIFNFYHGNVYDDPKGCSFLVRAFRCVTY